MPQPLTIWTNVKLPAGAMDQLRRGLGPDKLLQAGGSSANNLHGGAADPLIAEADVAFGQPDPTQVMSLPRLKWVQLTTAGYTRYDNREFRDAVKRNGTIVCNASSVYSEPCAQHALGLILSHARRLPQCFDNQRTDHGWPYLPLRSQSRLLNKQLVLLVGYGAIARRLAQLLEPLQVQMVGFRREVKGDEYPVRICHIRELDEWLSLADHVVNILPSSVQTNNFFNADRFAKFNRSAAYYNLGRGSTNDQDALRAALGAGHLAAAYIDATEPEPLPPDHPLWATPNCVITPHTAGGHANEYERHVELFLGNLNRLVQGQPLVDRVM